MMALHRRFFVITSTRVCAVLGLILCHACATAQAEDSAAVRDYREMLRVHPEATATVEKAAAMSASAATWLLAGQTRLMMNQYDLAKQDADAAQHLNAKLTGLATLQGMILEQQGDYDGAEAALRKALASNADDFNAQLYLGGIEYFKRDTQDARVHLLRALKLQPGAVQARYELALVACAEGQLEAALRDLETVVQESPNWLQPHVELAALYYRLHRPEDGAREKALVDRMLEVQQQTQSQSAH